MLNNNSVQIRHQPALSKVATIIGSEMLASDICRAIDLALKSGIVRLGGRSVNAVFDRSLKTAIRDIEEHPRGKLFRRLILYGTPDPDDPQMLTSDGETILSDPECGSCVDFIYWHMISRFKGELAELLALEPCVRLVSRLQSEGRLPFDAHLFWGPVIREHRYSRGVYGESGQTWGGYAKGADGLVVHAPSGMSHGSQISIHGIVEVKSMPRSSNSVIDQIERHRARLSGGVRLGPKEWSSDRVRIASQTISPVAGDSLVRVIVLPSTWKSSRSWNSVRIDTKTRALVLEEMPNPPIETRVEQLGQDDWKITLAWSQEALAEAALEMTVWYMAQVGARVFADRPVPRGLESMSPEEAGVNQIKYRLYVIGLRYVSRRQEKVALRLYNAYAFGARVAADHKEELLWPDDFPADKILDRPGHSSRA